MEPDSSLLCLQEPATSPYPEPDNTQVIPNNLSKSEALHNIS
jgi:hypothetical protein